MTSVTSSAPARPRPESCSDIAVKPEMSINASVPSSSRQDAAGSSRSHSNVSRGTNGTRSADAWDSALVEADVIGGILLYRGSTAKRDSTAEHGPGDARM